MKHLKLILPEKMTDYINSHPVDEITAFKRAAFLLYAYIDAGMISHGKAAELLGVDKFDLIDFYGGYGIPYVTLEGTRKFIESENRLNSFYAQRRKENE